VTSAGQALKTPLPGGGKPNPECAQFQKREDPANPDDNNASVGSVIAYGQFRLLDLADLLWNKEGELMCPTNPIGPVDIYMASNHGSPNAGSGALIHAVRPRVAIVQNGTRKGGSVAAFEVLETSPGIEDIWQLHWATAAGQLRVSHRRAPLPGGCGHPGNASGKSGVAANPDESSGHLAADPVRGASGHVDRSALHVGAEVHPDVADDIDAAAAHPPADPADLLQLATNLELVADLAVNGEEVVDAALLLAQIDGQCADRLVLERCHRIRAEHFRFQRDELDRFLQRERDHSGSDDTTGAVESGGVHGTISGS